MYNLSEKAIAEKYEDLLFTKVMALYAAEESEKILSEIENEEPADPKNIEKIYSKTERRENLSVFWKVSKKLITFAAMVVFVAVVSLSSVVVASAEAREAVAEAIYHLVLEEHEEYTRVSIGESTGFIDPEIYTWDDAYAPTYIPDGYYFNDILDLINQQIVSYKSGDNYINFKQAKGAGFSYQNTENAELTKTISIGESEGFLIINNGISTVTWSIDDTLLSVNGTAPTEEIVKIAEGIKPIGKTETEEPAEEYEFVDPEIYDWEGAYAPTYVPNNYKFSDKYVDISYYAITYTCNDKYFYIDQTLGHPISQIDTENAQIVKEVIINGGQGILVVKNDLTSITWNVNNILFDVGGTAPTEEIIKIAEGIKPIN